MTDPPPRQMILYLHGFRSSPQSVKARALGERMAANGLADAFACPALSHVPDLAIEQADQIIASCREPVTLVGSSLGGYYATWLAETRNLRAVLVNPAVIAHLSLSEFVGPQDNLYTGEPFEFTTEHVAQLQAMEVRRPNPSRYLLLVEQGDELLDWRHAVDRYAGCRQQVFEGGDHSFTRFEQCIPLILEFAGHAPDLEMHTPGITAP